MSDVSLPRPPAEDPPGPLGPPASTGPLFDDEGADSNDDAVFMDDYDVWDFSDTTDPAADPQSNDPDAAMIAALLDYPLTPAVELADAIAWCYDDAALPLLLPVAGHDDARVRRAVAQALPSVLGDADPADAVRVLIRLSVDTDEDVRDWACFALGTQLSEVDSPQVRDALLARLGDPHDDTRCEALLGLARRRDPRVLPVLRERLARDNAFSLEIDAAGAIGHPSLHSLVRGHLSGWDDDVVARVCAALRLTDPDGVGDDLLDGLAAWFQDGAPHADDEERYWWSVTLQVLEHAEYRAPEIAEAVRHRLAPNATATALMLGSRLAQLAGDHGWPHWSD
jgi:HEAT repeat protein